MTFGEKFKQTLDQREITQKQFALKMHVSESAISDYVNNRSMPNILLARDFAKELGVSVDYLLDYQPDPKSLAISPEEASMLKEYRSLPDEQQKLIKYLIDTFSHHKSDTKKF